MFCTKCGNVVGETAAFCSTCGQPAVDPSLGARATPGFSPPPAAPAQSVQPAVPGAPPGLSYAPVVLPSPFAGFWLRLVAHIIDSLILGVGVCMILLVVAAIVGLGFIKNNFESGDGPDAFVTAAIVAGFVVVFLFVAVGLWLYYASMESSSYQGTMGKIALGLIVTDLEGRRITFGRATARFCAGRVLGMIPLFGGLYFLISCICAGFTEKKQALHDMIASCLVLRKN